MKQSSTIFLYFFSITLKADFKSILFVSFRRTAHRYKEKMTADSFCQYRHLSFKNIFLTINEQIKKLHNAPMLLKS